VLLGDDVMKLATRRRVRLIEQTTHLDTAKCIFCGSPKVTREHVFSQWMHPFMPPRSNKPANVRISVDHKDRTDLVDNLRLSGPLRDWQIRCACGNYTGCCNNEWMSDIERRAQATMEPMLRGESIRLSEADQKAIATWAILKVMVAHHRFVHHMQRKQMRAKHEPPKQWSVWLSAFGGKTEDGHWLVRPFSLNVAGSRRRPNRTGAIPNSHATTQIIKNILIHVVKLPMDDFGTRWKWRDHAGAPLRGTILRIWPPTGQSILWPQKALTVPEALIVADAVDVATRRLAIEQGLLRPVR